MKFTKPLKLKRKSLKRKPKPKVSQAVKAYVNKQIHVDQENKVAIFAGSTTFGTIAQNSTLNMFPILPYTTFGVISQGITQGARIGNEIKIRKVMLNYLLHPTAYNATSNPLPNPTEVEMYLGYTKGEPGVLPVAADVNVLYQSGSTAYGPQGLLTDLLATINTDYWHISKRWRHKVGYSNYSGTGTQPIYQSQSNNDFKLNVVKKLDITKFVTKTLKFNDSNNTLQGKNLFFFYQATSAMGNGLTSLITPVAIDFFIDIQYEDA